MAGTFRLVTNQSHTRFEGKDRKQRKTYFGAGHEKAAQGGDLITLTFDEQDSFKDARTRLHLVTGDWSPELRRDIAREKEGDNLPAPDPIDILLSNKVDVVVGELEGLDVDELERVLEIEKAGAARKGITETCEKLIEAWDGE